MDKQNNDGMAMLKGYSPLMAVSCGTLGANTQIAKEISVGGFAMASIMECSC